MNGHEEGVMTSDERWFQGHLQEIDEAECWELLRSREVGRVAYNDERGPMCVPITFVVGEGSVLFRVAPYSEVARHLPGARAALEVDDIDYFTRSGWSVVLRGSIEPLDSSDLPAPEARPTPWPEGQRTLHLRLTPDTVTGRRLLEA
jgi:nitroimidazol reductase NimA-like FMN-containing flavoprotein (pyridoxamine 5'-phosphate oxidase superfamily)